MKTSLQGTSPPPPLRESKGGGLLGWGPLGWSVYYISHGKWLISMSVVYYLFISLCYFLVIHVISWSDSTGSKPQEGLVVRAPVWRSHLASTLNEVIREVKLRWDFTQGLFLWVCFWFLHSSYPAAAMWCTDLVNTGRISFGIFFLLPVWSSFGWTSGQSVCCFSTSEEKHRWLSL